MSILALESDKCVRMVGTLGAVMINNPSPSTRSAVSQAEREFTPARRDGARRSAPADQLMYAWSISAARNTSPEKHVVVRSHEECPPEVYLG